MAATVATVVASLFGLPPTAIRTIYDLIGIPTASVKTRVRRVTAAEG
jgi:hypothetical protein